MRIAIVFLILLNLFSESLLLSCYTCNSHNDEGKKDIEDCLDPFKSTTIPDNQCEPPDTHKDYKTTVCMKAVFQTSTHKEYERRCFFGEKGDADPCKHQPSTDDRTLVKCMSCPVDLCNEAPYGYNIALAVLSPIAAFSLSRFFYLS